MAKQLTKIVLYTRGKSKDAEASGPYVSYRAILFFNHVSYFRQLEVRKSMDWGSCGEWDAKCAAITGINEALGLNLRPDDKRIEQHHKHVYTYEEMRNSENWKINLNE